MGQGLVSQPYLRMVRPRPWPTFSCGAKAASLWGHHCFWVLPAAEDGAGDLRRSDAGGGGVLCVGGHPRTTLSDMAIRRPTKRSTPPIDLADMVRLIYWTRQMDAHRYQVGIIEGTVGDEVLVRCGEVV